MRSPWLGLALCPPSPPLTGLKTSRDARSPWEWPRRWLPPPLRFQRDDPSLSLEVRRSMVRGGRRDWVGATVPQQLEEVLAVEEQEVRLPPEEEGMERDVMQLQPQGSAVARESSEAEGMAEAMMTMKPLQEAMEEHLLAEGLVGMLELALVEIVDLDLVGTVELDSVEKVEQDLVEIVELDLVLVMQQAGMVQVLAKVEEGEEELQQLVEGMGQNAEISVVLEQQNQLAMVVLVDMMRVMRSMEPASAVGLQLREDGETVVLEGSTRMGLAGPGSLWMRGVISVEDSVGEGEEGVREQGEAVGDEGVEEVVEKRI
uniref:Uncharacterized protein n=1 Tax=Cacopsylla melanoneura TaxID=428564 RepID=A0A8D9AP01_9HEMI